MWENILSIWISYVFLFPTDYHGFTQITHHSVRVGLRKRTLGIADSTSGARAKIREIRDICVRQIYRDASLHQRSACENPCSFVGDYLTRITRITRIHTSLSLVCPHPDGSEGEATCENPCLSVSIRGRNITLCLNIANRKEISTFVGDKKKRHERKRVDIPNTWSNLRHI